MRGLTRLQRQLAKIVLAAAEPYGFALAGGAGLVAAGLSPRPTEDIDAFSASVSDVRPAAEAVMAALAEEGFAVERLRSGQHFVRLMVTTGIERRRRQVKIELGRDYFEWAPITSTLGAVLSHRELATNKVLALFSRVAPRDLCDVATLSDQDDLEQMLVDAKTKDPGFSRPIMAEMIRRIATTDPEDWPPAVDVDAVRDFGERLAEALEAGKPVDGLAPNAPVWPE
ncbi:MAG: nucleotidyl transferase AbiEii/AbiGii toxin family protein [Acidimicrobiales bacterium]